VNRLTVEFFDCISVVTMCISFSLQTSSSIMLRLFPVLDLSGGRGLTVPGDIADPY